MVFDRDPEPSLWFIAKPTDEFHFLTVCDIERVCVPLDCVCSFGACVCSFGACVCSFGLSVLLWTVCVPLECVCSFGVCVPLRELF